MANFFPAPSRLDIERSPTLNRRAHSRNALREAANDSPSDSRPARPSHINWLQNSMATTQAGPSMPRRPPSVQLGRSASLSALRSQPPALRRQSSLISNHSLQINKSSTSRTGTNPAAAPVRQLSPISERSYTPTPKQEHLMDTEPNTPVSIGSTYSAFLRRPLKRSISATSTSSLRTNATPTHPPVLPPLNISPLDIRPAYPPVSHRAGQQLVSTVYEDAGSERTGSFVTARSDSDDEEDAETDLVAPFAHAPAGPSNSTTLSATTQPGKSDPDRATEGTTALGSNIGGSSGSGSGDISSNSAFGPMPPARPRPRRRAPISGGSGSESEGSIWHRWTRQISVGSSGPSRPSFSAAHRAIKSRLPPLPILLFWAGFLAPWCWLIGGWLIAEGRWEDNGKARAALPLWKPRPNETRGTAAGKRPRGLRHGGARGAGVGAWGSETVRGVAEGPQLPFDPFAKDLEQGDAAAATVAVVATTQERQAGAERGRKSGGAGGDPIGGPREWWYWVPCADGKQFTCLPVRHSCSVGSGGGAAGAVPSPGSGPPRERGPGGPSSNGEKVVTLVKPYSAEVWVYRCRVAAVMSALILLTALIVALVVIRSTNA